jgi:hypothetical protein
MEVIDTALARGNHISTTTKGAVKLILNDVDYKVKAKFTDLIKWKMLQEPPPPKNLKVSPVVVIFYDDQRG